MGHALRIQRAAKTGKQQPCAQTCSCEKYREDSDAAAPACSISLFARATITLPAPEEKLQSFIKEASLVQAQQRVEGSALTLTADQFSTSYQPSNLSTIKMVMWPEAEMLVALPHKLEIYRPGNSRKAGVCTPPGDGLVGFLLVLLPQDHSGGRLKVWHQEEGEKKCDMAYSWDHHTDWIAFTHNCEQEVGAVGHGACIILTYHLYCQGHAGIPRGLTEDSTPLFNALAAGILCNRFLPLGGAVGFTTHLPYPHITKDGKKVLSMLTGKDKDRKQVLKVLGLHPQMGAVLDLTHLQQRLGCYWPHGDTPHRLGDDIGESHSHLCISKLRSHWTYWGERLREGESTLKDVGAYRLSLPARGIVWLAHSLQHSESQVTCKVYDRDGNYLPEEVYSTAAVFAVVPAWGTAARQAIIQRLGGATAAAVAAASDAQGTISDATYILDADKE